jgi:hypothetical protein
MLQGIIIVALVIVGAIVGTVEPLPVAGEQDGYIAQQRIELLMLIGSLIVLAINGIGDSNANVGRKKEVRHLEDELNAPTPRG